MIDYLNMFAVFMLPFSLLGLFLVFHVMRGQNAPADASNRINKIRLIWFVLTREEMFVGRFKWLKNDELDNVDKRIRDQ